MNAAWWWLIGALAAAWAAAHFPALHAALLEQQAAAKGLASASVLRR